MMDSDLGILALIGIVIAMSVVAWEMRHPNPYRKGCNECDAAKRRDLEARRELAHDIQHRGVKAPGMPAPTVDRWPCDDPKCPRNPRRPEW